MAPPAVAPGGRAADTAADTPSQLPPGTPQRTAKEERCDFLNERILTSILWDFSNIYKNKLWEESNICWKTVDKLSVFSNRNQEDMNTHFSKLLTYVEKLRFERLYLKEISSERDREKF